MAVTYPIRPFVWTQIRVKALSIQPKKHPQ